MKRTGWLVVLFVASMLGTMTLGSPVTGQAPKVDPKKTDPAKKDDKKPKTKPVEPKKDPPKPSPPPAPPAVPPGPSELDGPTVDTSKPANPLDLVRGLRNNDANDLALEYLTVLGTRPLPPDLKLVLPLEAALTRLEVAKDESDGTKRDALLNQAKAEFEQFEKANPSHPRAIEAAIARARATSFQGRSQLSRALKLPKEGDKDKTAAEKVQSVFEEASRQFKSAAAKLTDLLADANLSPARKVQLTRELNQAQLEAGINLFEQSRALVRPAGGKELTSRNDSLKAAKAAFKVVGDRDANNPFSWIAKAWAIECDYAMQQVAEADKQATALRTDANRYPAARDGVRMLRYFEVARKYAEARSPQELSAARLIGERWLGDYRTVKGSREQFAVMYYVATLRKEEAIATGVKTSKQGDQVKIDSVSSGALSSLRTVDRELRKLAETDNDYSERASNDRTQVIRLIIGDKLKPAGEYKSFEEAQMAALVEMSSALRDEKLAPADRMKKMANSAEYLQQAISVVGPGESVKDVLDARIQLTYAYLQAGQPHRAAVLGEHLARTARSPSEAARAGAMAVQAYLGSGTVADDELKPMATAVDRERAMALATSLEAKFPGESSTDTIRSLLGSQLYRNGQHTEAFKVLSRVSSQFPGVVNARLMEGAAAYLAIQPKSPVPPKEKKEIFDRAIADLNAVSEPAATASAGDARAYLRLRQQLVELYLLDSASMAKAIAAATELERKPTRFTNLSPIAKKVHAFDAERLRLTALATQATVPFNEANWAAFSQLIDPALAELAKQVAQSGTAIAQAEKVKSETEPELSGELAGAADKLDRFRREKIVLLALQTKIRSGATDQTGELIDLMEKLGGSLDANAATLGQLLGTVKNQAAALRKQKKTDDAEKLTSAVGDLFMKFAAKPNLPVKYQYFAGKALNDLGQANKAIELLKSLPEAPLEDLKKNRSELAEDRKNAVTTHYSAKLELAKAYRLTGQFDEAQNVLKAQLGDDKEPGWAARVLDYRKEAIWLIEARAEKASGKAVAELWGQANQAWGKLAREYGSVLSQPLPKDEDKRNEANRRREQIKPIYFKLFADSQRCLVRANAMLLKDNPDALGKRYDSIVKSIRMVETQNPDLGVDVREQYADLIDESSLLKDKYKAAGGKMFLRDASGQLPAPDA